MESASTPNHDNLNKSCVNSANLEGVEKRTGAESVLIPHSQEAEENRYRKCTDVEWIT